MTDTELKKYMKRLVIVLLLLIICMAALSVYVLGGQKAELSLYTNVNETDNLQTLGIDEAEFREYLAVFGNLVNPQNDENQRKLNMATNFIENLHTSSELQNDETSLKSYMTEEIHAIIKEVEGTNLTSPIEGGEIYKYVPEENKYQQCQDLEKMMCCIKIKSIEKQKEAIEVIYELGIMTKEQMAQYETGQPVEFETHQVKAMITINENYEYSKYFVNKIEII